VGISLGEEEGIALEDGILLGCDEGWILGNELPVGMTLGDDEGEALVLGYSEGVALGD